MLNQSEPSAKIEPPFLAYLESSKMLFFAKYRLQSHLNKHQLKIILYLVVHILPLKIIFLLIYFCTYWYARPRTKNVWYISVDIVVCTKKFLYARCRVPENRVHGIVPHTTKNGRLIKIQMRTSSTIGSKNYNLFDKIPI